MATSATTILRLYPATCPRSNNSSVYVIHHDAGVHLSIRFYSQDLQTKVVEPLLTLVAIALELPENYLRNIHQYEVKSEVRRISLYQRSGINSDWHYLF